MSFVAYNKADCVSVSSELNSPQEFLTDSLGSVISKDFKGHVVDVDQKPLVGAEVTIGNKTTITDSNGFYKIEDAEINENHSSVKVSRKNYIDNLIDIIASKEAETDSITLKKTDEVCLYWFCKYH